jgi:hypothetical protein
MDKRMSLLQNFVNYRQNLFITLGPGANVTKAFTAVESFITLVPLVG